MNRLLVVPKNQGAACTGGRPVLRLLALLICCGLTAPAQNTSQPGNASAPFSVRATHLLGFENVKNNRKGTLSIQDNTLQFQQNGKPGAQLKITSVRDVFVGEESKQVGGVPVMLGKAAVPFGGGRVLSLFTHKKYETVTLEYVDSDGGVHGAIFRLTKGEGKVVKDELAARGVAVSSREDQSTKPGTAEVTHENK